MAAALHHGPSSPLEDKDLLPEILLRLSPQPSSLPRASAVCKRWRSLVSDRGFVRRYRRHHRSRPPLLGFFRNEMCGISYTPAMEVPDRVPAGRFSLHLGSQGYRPTILSCRHGLVLISLASQNQILVWDPVTGDQHIVVAPLGFDMKSFPMTKGAVLRAAGDAHHFQVVLVSYDYKHTQAIFSIYSSETGGWSNLISTPVPPKARHFSSMPAVLAGDSLYWLLFGFETYILQVDLDSQSLAVIPVPKNMFAISRDLMVMRAEGGGLGLLSLSGYTAKLWKMNTDRHGVASWVLGQTVELDKLLPLSSVKVRRIGKLAYAEENNVALLLIAADIFTVQLESLHFSKLAQDKDAAICHPLESVYAADIGGGHDGADQDMLA